MGSLALLLGGQALAAAPAKRPPPAPVPVAYIPTPELLDMQDGLVKQAVAALPARAIGRPNVYALAIAASGRQQLFSREAHLALQVAAQRFGADYRGGLLLSNGAPDLTRAPLATRGNLLMAADGLARHTDAGQDIAFLYLVSHGGQDASLETDLPNLQNFTALNAKALAEALNIAGVKRRIIIISACFSGGWIPALANDDTIIIAAARFDRTSFGCDDTRRLTFFGQAFLEGPLAKGASLAEAFEAARQQISGWEAKARLLPSEPQIFVGQNMQALWTARGPASK